VYTLIVPSFEHVAIRSGEAWWCRRDSTGWLKATLRTSSS
jgi:hypothetical protein